MEMDEGVVAITDEEQDQAEVEAFTKIVEKYVIANPAKSLKIKCRLVRK